MSGYPLYTSSSLAWAAFSLAVLAEVALALGLVGLHFLLEYEDGWLSVRVVADQTSVALL